MVKKIQLVSELPDDYVQAMEGKFVTEAHYKTLVQGDTDVIKPDGTPLLSLRRNVISADLCKRAYPVFWKAATRTDTRTAASGFAHSWVLSGTLGFLEPTLWKKHPGPTGTTAAMMKNGTWERDIVPFTKAVNEVYRNELPDTYRRHLAIARKTRDDLIIPGTVFTTITVNRDFRTAVHADSGNLPEGFGAMCVFKGGEANWNDGLLSRLS